MEQKENKWADSYRKRLRDYTEPVSDEIWNSLEKELVDVPLKSTHAHAKMAAAAVILLLVTSSLSLLFLQSPQAEYVKEGKKTVKLEEPSTYSKPSSMDQTAKITTKSQTHLPQQMIHENSWSEKEIAADDRKEDNISSEKMTEQTNETANKKQANQVSDFSLENRSSGADRSSFSMNKGLKREKKLAVGISVGNVPSSNNELAGFGNKSTVMRDDDPMSISELMVGEASNEGSLAAKEAFRQILLNTVRKEAQTDIKHKMPFTVGVSFRFALSSKFSVETGLNYTLLSSTLRAGTSTDYYLKEQRLHYIGIPLKGNWMFFNTKYFSLYLSAGGTIEKSVSGSLKADYVTSNQETIHETQALKIKPVQWSLNSAIGAQYNATRHLGIFVEPGIVYYFDDGSQVETIRKEKPFNFNLQMGLRFTY